MSDTNQNDNLKKHPVPPDSPNDSVASDAAVIHAHETANPQPKKARTEDRHSSSSSSSNNNNNKKATDVLTTQDKNAQSVVDLQPAFPSKIMVPTAAATTSKATRDLHDEKEARCTVVVVNKSHEVQMETETVDQGDKFLGKQESDGKSWCNNNSNENQDMDKKEDNLKKEDNVMKEEDNIMKEDETMEDNVKMEEEERLKVESAGQEEGKEEEEEDAVLGAHKSPNKHDGSGASSLKEDNNNNHKNWLEMVALMRQAVSNSNQKNKDNCEDFVQSAEERMAASARFDQGIVDFQNCMDTVWQDWMHQVVVSVHEDFQRQFQGMEADIVETAVQNHERRVRLTCHLKSQRNEWKTRTNALFASIDNCGTVDEQDEMVLSPVASPNHCRGSDGSGTEPDWDKIIELADDDRTRESIRSFLRARDIKAKADQALDVFYHTMQEAFKEQLKGAMVNLATKTFHTGNQVLDVQEHDIHSHILGNHDRRQALKKIMKESTKLTNGFFAEHLASVNGGLGNCGPVSSNASS